MANISSAYGEFTFYSKNKDHLLKLVRLIKDIGSSWYYETQISKFNYTLEVTNKENKDYAKHCLNVDFSGLGRWTYVNNIESLILTLMLEEERKEEIKEVLSHPFSLSAFFAEYEAGFEIFQEVSINASFDPKKEDSWIIESINYYPIDLTAKNLMQYEFADYAIDDSDSSIREQKEELIEYFDRVEPSLSEKIKSVPVPYLKDLYQKHIGIVSDYNLIDTLENFGVTENYFNDLKNKIFAEEQHL